MGVDVPDVRRRELRIGDRQFHAARRAGPAGGGRSDVVGVRRARATEHQRVDVRAPGLSVGQLLEHQHRPVLALRRVEIAR